MPFSVTVNAQLLFEQGHVFVIANGQKLDFMTLDSIEEMRVAFYGIASKELEQLAQPKTTTPGTVGLDGGGHAAATVAESFRRQTERAQNQLDEFKATYEASLAALNLGGDSDAKPQ